MGVGRQGGAQSTGRPTQLRATHRWMLPEPVRLPTLSAARALCHGEHLLCLHHDRLHRHTSRESAPSQACNAKTDLSDFLNSLRGWEMVGGRLSRTLFTNSTVRSRKYFFEAPQNALSRSHSKRRRQKTPHNGPLAPAPQAPHHARAPAEDPAPARAHTRRQQAPRGPTARGSLPSSPAAKRR